MKNDGMIDNSIICQFEVIMKKGFMSYKDPEDAQRPRALYDGFRSI